MAYTKTNWQTGDVIDATKLNHAEDGIAQAQQTADTANARDSLADLTDVDITTPTDGQVILYDGTNSKWVNGSAGSTPEVNLTINSNGYLSVTGRELETLAATSKVKLTITSTWSRSATYSGKTITMSAAPGTYYLTAFAHTVGASYRRFYFQGLNNVEYFESSGDSDKPQSHYPTKGLNDNNINVLITSPTNGQVLRYNGSRWVNGAATPISMAYLTYYRDDSGDYGDEGLIYMAWATDMSSVPNILDVSGLQSFLSQSICTGCDILDATAMDGSRIGTTTSITLVESTGDVYVGDSHLSNHYKADGSGKLVLQTS